MAQHPSYPALCTTPGTCCVLLFRIFPLVSGEAGKLCIDIFLYLQLVGCVFIGVGAWAYIEKNRFTHSEVQSIYDVIFDISIVIIVVGCVIFLVAFTGCVGALRENVCLLKFVSIFH